MLILLLTTLLNAFFVFSLLLFFWHPATSKKKRGGAQADQRLLGSAKHWYVLGEAESHLWLSTHYHDDSAAYHLDEHATTEKMSPLSVYKPFSAM